MHQPIILFLCTALLSITGHAQINLGRDSVWVQKDIEWRTPETGYPAMDTLSRYSLVECLVFTGKIFLKSECPVNSSPKLDSIQVEVTPGNFYTGFWEQINDTTIQLTYYIASLRNRTKQEFTDTMIFRNNYKEIFFQGKSYVVATNLTKNSIDFLRWIAHRPYADLYMLTYR